MATFGLRWPFQDVSDRGGGSATPEPHPMPETDPWRGFARNGWCDAVDVRSFIQANVTPYLGDGDFLVVPAAETLRLTRRVEGVSRIEGAEGRDILQAVSCEVDPAFALFAPASDGIQGAAREAAAPTEAAATIGRVVDVPVRQGRAQIVGDYRRVALYGLDRLIDDWSSWPGVSGKAGGTTEAEREAHVAALVGLRDRAAAAGLPLGRPAATAREALTWMLAGYLAAASEHPGIAVPFGRASTFLDIFVTRDLTEGRIDAAVAQDLFDRLTLALRVVHAMLGDRSGDALAHGWITETVGGMSADGRPLVTRGSYRMLHGVFTLGVAPVPNLAVLWSQSLPHAFKRYCARLSVQTSALQYENDDLLRPHVGDDYAVVGCATAVPLGRRVAQAGAVINLPKLLLLALNGGRDEEHGVQVAPSLPPVADDILEYETVLNRLDILLEWGVRYGVEALSEAHAELDRTAYEAVQMSLMDPDPARTQIVNVSGLSVVVDSLMAARQATVRVWRNHQDMAVDFDVHGRYAPFGICDDVADATAQYLLSSLNAKLACLRGHREAQPQVAVAIIDRLDGEVTGATPDGRRPGDPFAPGANPMHGRDSMGPACSMASVARVPYAEAQGGICYTFTIVPAALGQELEDQAANLIDLVDAYVDAGGQHLNLNVLDRAQLVDALEHPGAHASLTARIAGGATRFVSLSRDEQLEFLARTFHGAA